MGEDPAAGRPLALFRLIVGLGQGLALYLLYSAYDAKSWPATDSAVFAPLLLVALFVPLIALAGAGNLRPRTLIAWLAAATLLVAALAWYDIWRGWPADLALPKGGNNPLDERTPTFALFFFLAAGLFIAQALIAGGDADRKFMARYTTHFDVAWKLGVQVGLATAFVAAFWLILWLGSELFLLIKLDFFQRLIEHAWFGIPATTLATAAALHVSDVRAGLVRGVRTLALVLLSWLLPLMTLIGAGFLTGLIFTGLAPLWATRHAAALLLVAAAVLVILINAAYQDGYAERQATPFFNIAIRVASVLLLPVVALAAYAIWLRVDQYGWSVDRVASAACTLVAACYATGYSMHAIVPARRLIETWNFATALLVLAVLFALFTPLADPARISVGSQMARLQAGKVKADALDYNFLRWQAGRYGRDALLKLAAKDVLPAIRVQANAALAAKVQYSSPTVPTAPVNLAKRLIVHPAGRPIPPSFFTTKWSDDPASVNQASCVTAPEYICDLLFADVDGDGRDEILLIAKNAVAVVIYKQTSAGWRIAGSFTLPYSCTEKYRNALLKGDFRLFPPVWQLKDIEIGGIRFVPQTPFALSAPSPICRNK